MGFWPLLLDIKEISEKIIHLYQTAGLVVLNGEILPSVLAVYVDKNIDFTDAVIGQIASTNHIEYLASLDKNHGDRLSDLGIKRVESPKEILQ